jgi:hypothetical protein
MSSIPKKSLDRIKSSWRYPDTFTRFDVGKFVEEVLERIDSFEKWHPERREEALKARVDLMAGLLDVVFESGKWHGLDLAANRITSIILKP